MQPLVTVLITTYNQQKYISKAIDSVLAQRTNFPFEILICEDHGSDSTQAIIQEYAEKNSIIRLILRPENIGISRNWIDGLMQAKGKYVCTLEGDDWWLDNNKLQKQVDFLESHPDYSAVSHRILQTDDSGNTYGSEPHDSRLLGKDATLSLFLEGVTFSFTACLCRNIFTIFDDSTVQYVTANRSIADFALCMLILDAGKVHVLDESLSAYRVAGIDKNHQNYNGTRSAVQKYRDHLQVLSESEKYWKEKYSFGRCYLADTYFPFCDSIKYGFLFDFIRVMQDMPLPYRLQFPFYFIARSLVLLMKRLARTAAR